MIFSKKCEVMGMVVVACNTPRVEVRVSKSVAR